MPSRRRDHLVDTALRLFCRDGYHATGIDRILAESGVAKMTLYKHFKSKDELIVAALHRRDEQLRDWFMQTVGRRAQAPRERLMAIFDVLEEWLSSREFSGCAFVNASAEYADRDDPVHRAAAVHKRLMLGYFRDLAAAAGATDADALARQLMLLVEGATVLVQVTGEADVAAEARRAAESLVGRALA